MLEYLDDSRASHVWEFLSTPSHLISLEVSFKAFPILFLFFMQEFQIVCVIVSYIAFLCT
jgi:hypothetical protein